MEGGKRGRRWIHWNKRKGVPVERSLSGGTVPVDDDDDVFTPTTTTATTTTATFSSQAHYVKQKNLMSTLELKVKEKICVRDKCRVNRRR